MKLKGSQDDINKLEVACNNCDFQECKDSIYEALEQQFASNELEIAKNGRFNWRKNQRARRENRRINIILGDENTFNAFCDRMIHESKQSLLDSGKVGEFGDGEFMKWWWQWFSEEGAQVLIKFIKQLFEIIMTVIGNAALSWAIAFAIAGLAMASMFTPTMI